MIRSLPSRTAYTLVELIMALAVTSILLGGMSSALFVAMRAADPASTPAAQTLEGLAALAEICTELQFAQTITEQTGTAITVSVPDRNDADTSPETIRFAWSGTPGAPLTRQVSGGTEADFLASVHDFKIQYYQPAAAVECVTVRVQTTNDPSTMVETTVPLLNRP